MANEKLIEIRPAPGRCCPEFDCLLGDWDGFTCRGCDCDCTGCVHHKWAIQDRLNKLNKVTDENFNLQIVNRQLKQRIQQLRNNIGLKEEVKFLKLVLKDVLVVYDVEGFQLDIEPKLEAEIREMEDNRK